METFQLAGSAPAAYERHLVPRLFEPLAAHLLELAPPAGRVLDVACGTGVVARQAAPLADAVTGIDINAGMIELARHSSPAIEWRVGDAEALEYPASSADVVYCQQGLQFMADPAAALRSMAAVLRPGGRVALALWRPLEQSPGFLALVQALDHHAGTAAGDVLRGPFRLGDHAEVVAQLRMAGFADIRVYNHCHAVQFGSVAHLVEAEIDATPLAQQAAGWAPGVREAVTATAEDALRSYTADDGLLFPMGAYVTTATKS
ncbi:MAG TPA: methyltransferase domain-containing protein [Micromonosporaceae bacterium]|nr:methyltransferase domain-containing protein [Micromonosporaceae bacterium]